jgi:hypothetical protein
MIESGGGPGFVQQGSARAGIRDSVGADELEGYIPLQREVSGQVDLAETAAAEQSLEFVAVSVEGVRRHGHARWCCGSGRSIQRRATRADAR